MGYRHWTTLDRRRAREMRAADATDKQIAAALGRSENAVSLYLRKHDLSGAECRRVRESRRLSMLRRALPMWRGGMSIPAVAKEIGWPATRQALWQQLRKYERDLRRAS